MAETMTKPALVIAPFSSWSSIVVLFYIFFVCLFISSSNSSNNWANLLWFTKLLVAPQHNQSNVLLG